MTRCVVLSNAFNIFNHSKRMKILKTVLTPSKLHMMHLLMNDVILSIRLGDKIRKDTRTAIGLCQGDRLPTLLLILCLVYAIKPLLTNIQLQDYQQPLWSALDWIIDRNTRKVSVDPIHADDITFIQLEKTKIDLL